ncbi:VTT domain-containing protein [Desulfotomaculum varum]
MIKRKSFILIAVCIMVAAVLFYARGTHWYSFWSKPPFSSPEHLADYLRSFGAMTVVISLSLMVMQTLFTPLPLFLLAGANGFIFGLWYGILITLTGSVIGASIAFFLARGFGRGLVCRFLKETYMVKVDRMSCHEGPWMVFMARLIPVIPSSIISYVAGLSRMTFRGFFIATAVGKLPEIIIYTALGHSFSVAEGMATKITLLLILLTLLAWPLISRKLKKTSDDASPKTPPG